MESDNIRCRKKLNIRRRRSKVESIIEVERQGKKMRKKAKEPVQFSDEDVQLVLREGQKAGNIFLVDTLTPVECYDGGTKLGVLVSMAKEFYCMDIFIYTFTLEGKRFNWYDVLEELIESETFYRNVFALIGFEGGEKEGRAEWGMQGDYHLVVESSKTLQRFIKKKYKGRIIDLSDQADKAEKKRLSEIQDKAECPVCHSPIHVKVSFNVEDTVTLYPDGTHTMYHKNNGVKVNVNGEGIWETYACSKNKDHKIDEKTGRLIMKVSNELKIKDQIMGKNR